MITFLTPFQARDIMMQEKNNLQFTILDVRTPAEFEITSLPKAINIDIYSYNFADRINALDRNKIYLVYCNVGGRSSSAAELMSDFGFEKIYCVKGKLFE